MGLNIELLYPSHVTTLKTTSSRRKEHTLDNSTFPDSRLGLVERQNGSLM